MMRRLLVLLSDPRGTAWRSQEWQGTGPCVSRVLPKAFPLCHDLANVVHTSCFAIIRSMLLKHDIGVSRLTALLQLILVWC